MEEKKAVPMKEKISFQSNKNSIIKQYN